MKLFERKNREKTALVLSGGGSRGSYQVGVWNALREMNIDIDMVMGTSAGALNATMVCLNRPEVAEQLWLSTTSREVFDLDTSIPDSIQDIGERLHITEDLFSRLSLPPDQFAGYAREFIRHGGVSGSGMEKLLKKYVDEDRIRRSRIDMGVVTVGFPSMKPYKLMKDDIPYGKLRQFVQASASCFPVMHYCVIDGEKYIDGGFSDNLPVSMALDRKADRIIAVDLQAVGHVDDDILAAAAEHSDFHHIRSSFDLGHFLNFDPLQAKENIRYGYIETLRAFGKLEGERYFFRRGSVPPHLLAMADACADVFQCDRREIYTEQMLIDELRMKVLDAEVALKKSPLSGISLHSFTDPSLLRKRISAISPALNRQALTVLICRSLEEKDDSSVFCSHPLSQIFSHELEAARYISARDLLNY